MELNNMHSDPGKIVYAPQETFYSGQLSSIGERNIF